MPMDLFDPHLEIDAGTVQVNEVVLCSMNGRKPGEFYVVEAALDLTGDKEVKLLRPVATKHAIDAAGDVDGGAGGAGGSCCAAAVCGDVSGGSVRPAGDVAAIVSMQQQ